MGMIWQPAKPPKSPAPQFLPEAWPGLTCLVKVVSGHLKQAQVHVGDGVEGATGQEHHRDSALHPVGHIRTRCCNHPAFIGAASHQRVGTRCTITEIAVKLEWHLKITVNVDFLIFMISLLWLENSLIRHKQKVFCRLQKEKTTVQISVSEPHTGHYFLFVR